jgi:hypothetical protein
MSRWHDGPAKILFPINADPDEDQRPGAIRLTKISVESGLSGKENLSIS